MKTLKTYSAKQLETIAWLSRKASEQFNEFSRNIENKELKIETELSNYCQICFVFISSKSKESTGLLCLTDRHYFFAIGKNGGIKAADEMKSKVKYDKYVAKGYMYF